MSPRREISSLSGQLVLVLHHLHSIAVLPGGQRKHLELQFVAVASCPDSALLRTIWLHLSLLVLVHIEILFFSELNSCRSLSLSPQERCSSSFIILMTLWTLCSVSCLSYWGERLLYEAVERFGGKQSPQWGKLPWFFFVVVVVSWDCKANCRVDPFLANYRGMEGSKHRIGEVEVLTSCCLAVVILVNVSPLIFTEGGWSQARTCWMLHCKCI